VTALRVALLGDPRRLALHGIDGSVAATRLRCFFEGDAAGVASFAPDVLITLESQPPAAHPGRRLLWRERAAAADAEHPTIGPGGSGLWRRAPLPTADALFDPPSGEGRGILVVDGDPVQRGRTVDALRRKAIDTRSYAEPSPDDLASASTIVVVGGPDEPLPALAIAALARGRLVLAPRSEPSFGLNPGVDHLTYAHEDELVRVAQAADAWPRAFTAIAAMGRAAAEAHRASVVYPRMAADLLAR
jgi:hypothetical protein